MVQGGMFPRLSKAKIKMCDLPSRTTFREILLIRIHIMEIQDKRGTMKYLIESCYHRIECSVVWPH